MSSDQPKAFLGFDTSNLDLVTRITALLESRGYALEIRPLDTAEATGTFTHDYVGALLVLPSGSSNTTQASEVISILSQLKASLNEDKIVILNVDASTTPQGLSNSKIIYVSSRAPTPHIAGQLDSVFPSIMGAAGERTIADSALTDAPAELQRERSCITEIFDKLSTCDESHCEMQSDDTDRSIGYARVPNFLVFKRGERLVLAIVDHEKRVDEYGLQETYAPKVRASIYSGSIVDLGFSHGFVHPFFRDANELFERIVVDGVLYFQAALFPRSRIMVPTIEGNRATKRTITSSRFISILEMLHGTKVMVANISKKGWPDKMLLQMISQSKCRTRFAPTPSNSLHIGNVRSAMIPYILARRGGSDGHCMLRFDDTNQATIKSEFLDSIRSDLRWLGFLFNRHLEFRQSARSRRQIYEDVLSLLRKHHYVFKAPDGNEWLDATHPNLQHASWFDINRGPVIFHTAPKRFANQEVGDLSLTNVEHGGLKYKFAGSVDDFLYCTHIVRDIRQEHLTDRQALIRRAIEQAWRASELAGSQVEERRRLTKHRLSELNPASGLLPPTTPPVYIHVPYVADEAGSVLSKRDLNPNFSMQTCRARNVLPETIVSFIASTIVPTSRDSGRDRIRDRLACLAGQLAAVSFVDLFANQLSVYWLLRKRRPIRVSERELASQERRVIRYMSYTQFRRKILEYCARAHMAVPDAEEIKRWYPHRLSFSSWRELTTIILGSDDVWNEAEIRVAADSELPDEILKAARDDPSALLATIRTVAKVSLDENGVLASIRRTTTGMSQGPPISELVRILGQSEFARRLIIRRA